MVVFAGLYLVYRNRERLGAGAGYAKDPVCGMQVEIAYAPASTTHAGRSVYFCSDRCADRFAANADRYLLATESPEAGHDAPDHGDGGPRAVDLVCGMTVDSAFPAASLEHDGQTVYFCSAGCRDAFLADPKCSVSVSGLAEGTDPVCGVTVEPAHAAEHRDGDRGDVWFCSNGCAAAFDEQHRAAEGDRP